jgi:hypothetical protein
MNRLALIILMALSLLVLPAASCIQQALPRIAQGAQLLGSVVDVAEAGSKAYFAKHANMESQLKVEAKIRQLRQAIAALNTAQLLAKSATDGNLIEAKDYALELYKQLRALLVELGVLDAKPPMGGATGEGPDPEPFELPTVEQIEAAMDCQ